VTAPVRVLIVDDEHLAREGVRGLLAADHGVTVVGECGNGHDAVAAIRGGGVDVVLLDVQMPGLDGFGVIREVGADELPVVVFLTAYDQHALKAFDANAIDYVVKPFSDERFHAAIARACKQVRQRRLGEASESLARLLGAMGAASGVRFADRIAVRSVGKVAYVRVADIVWIGAADYYAELHTRDGKTHLVREAMQRIEERLDPAVFARIHRSAIARVDEIAELRTDGAERHWVMLKGGTKLPLGKSRRDALERTLTTR
jgi:two-component system LytT family response regulator